jgi:hypothetical protein
MMRERRDFVKAAILVSITIVNTSLAGHTASAPAPISKKEAYSLAAMVSKNQAHQGAEIEIYDIKHSDYPCCYQFEAYAFTSNSVAGDALCHPLVSKRTGDVWDWVLDKRYDFGQLRKLQDEFRKRHQIEEIHDPDEERALGYSR